MIRKKNSGKSLTAWIAVALLLLPATPLSAQEGARAQPFAPGEILTYRAVSGRFGTLGVGTMKVEGPVDVRGERVLQLSFDFRGRVGIFGLQDRTRSWITLDDHSSLRYQKSERSPLGTRSEEVEIYPAEGRWQDAQGQTGETACQHPLDELSFLYFLRSLPLESNDEYTLTHHFDPGRNPVSVKVLRRETTEVPAGRFATVVVEMRVRDERVSAMRLFLTDDEMRVPVQIESSAPWVGSTRLVLEQMDTGQANPLQRVSSRPAQPVRVNPDRPAEAAR